MKDASLNIDLNKLQPNDEKITQMDIEISSYDPESAYLEFEEDLDEKTIGYIEKEVRSSYEYRAYTSYLKNELDLTRCALLPNLDCSDGAASLEYHHYPMNLYEISEAVGKQMIHSLGKDEKISCFEIAQRVVEEHYLGNIGLVPLTKTLHDMAHNKTIIVPISKVNGNYKKFLQKYSSFISDDIKDRIKEAEMNSESDESKLYNQTKLEKNIANYNITYYNSDEEEEDDE